MKLLVSWMRELSGYVSREFYYIMHDLIHVHGWKQVEPPELANDAVSAKATLLKLFGEIPEVILFWEAYDLCISLQPTLMDLGCTRFMFVDDLHMLWGKEEMRVVKMQALAACDAILSPYAYVFDEFFPELRGQKRVIWVPHSASPDFVRPFNFHADNAILLSGFINSLYPLRQQLKALHDEGRYPIILHQHPGYGTAYNYDNDTRVGAGYANTIHKYKAGFTDALTFKYVVAKHFEIPATGALLIADGVVSEPMKQLGFLPNMHYLPVSAEDLRCQIEYVLDHRHAPAVDAIRRCGQQLVLSSHTTRHRAELIDSVCTANGAIAG